MLYRQRLRDSVLNPMRSSHGITPMKEISCIWRLQGEPINYRGDNRFAGG